MAGRSKEIDLGGLKQALDGARLERVRGRVVEVVGTLAEAELPGAVIGGLCMIGESCLCEVVGFRERRALLMPLDSLQGVAFGSPVISVEGSIRVTVGEELVGRVLDGLGRPMDGGPSIRSGEQRRVEREAEDPLKRSVIGEPLETGIRVFDGMITVGKGQRIAIMAGSGVGKSTIMGMLARHVRAEVNVICLVGERGREVREFLERDLGPEGLARTVMVVITSDKSPVLQVKGAFVATAIAEFFRDQGKDVLLMMDSLTRFAMAQRQIGLSAGEPPTTKGYTPSVFSLLPKLLERAGPGSRGGSITGIYTVLVEGDDMNDPIGDAVRGIVDGHVVLSRKLASHGHYPAVDVLESLSRVMVNVTEPEHQEHARKIRHLMAIWAENEELIRLGAYKTGSSVEVDEAIAKHTQIREFLCQGVTESSAFEETVEAMKQFSSPFPPPTRDSRETDKKPRRRGPATKLQFR